MTPLNTKFIIGCVTAMLAQAAATADPSTVITPDSSTAAPVQTVRQQIAEFANRYGEPVILHGNLNLDALIAVSYDTQFTSDQAVSLLAQAAGGTATRVYFVTPATGSNVTDDTAAARLVADTGKPTLLLKAVSAKAAIEAVAAADNAEVRFPDGIPTGSVTLTTSTLPLDEAVARVAGLTQTHWSLGYVVDADGDSEENVADNTVTPGAAETNEEAAAIPKLQVLSSLPPLRPLARDAQGNILPFYVHMPIQPLISATSSTQGQGTGQQNTSAFTLQQPYISSSPNSNPFNQTPFDSTFNDSSQPEQTTLDNTGAVSTTVPSSGFRFLPGIGF